jgi:hypothetical protein
MFVDRARNCGAALLIGVLSVALLPASVLAAGPAALPQTVSTNEDVALPLVLDGTDADGDPLTFGIATPPTLGDLTALPPADCDPGPPSDCTVAVTYTPNANAHGSDSFTFSVDDGTGGTDTATIDITIDSVNDPPSGANATVSTLEDAPYVFQAADFGFTDSNDTPPDALLAVTIVSLPGSGTLTLNGAGVASLDSIAIADIDAGKLAFVPGANDNGSRYASLTFKVEDDGGTGSGGLDLDQTANTLTVDVTSVNDAPSGADNSVSTLADNSYPFDASDFGFSDPDDSPADSLADSLQAVKIATLPGVGTLTDSAVPVSVGQVVPVSDLAGNLVFTPNAGEVGQPYDSFTFQVQDDGGTANGGIDLDGSPNSMQIDVTPLNHAPSGADRTKSILEDSSLTFGVGDFGFTDAGDTPANGLLAVKVTTPPAAGLLKDNGVAVTAGGFVPAADIIANRLVFSPTLNANGTPYATFGFQVQDDGGTAGGGVDLDQSVNTITIDVTPVNDAPAGANNTIVINEDTSRTLAVGDFGLTDPFDSPPNILVNVKVTAAPLAGSLKDNGVTVVTGNLISRADLLANEVVYAPDQNANGSPYATFGFQVQDNGGTANGGINLDPSPNAMTINVTPVNDAPAGTNRTITINEDTSRTLLVGDFGLTDPNDNPPNILVNVRITATPLKGSLKDNGVTVLAGSLISRADLLANKMVYTPAPNGNGSTYATVVFQVQDNGGTANGGINLDPSPNTITIAVTPVNDVPNAVNDAGLTVPESAGPTALAVKANDTDIDGDTLLITAATNGAHGAVAITGGGTGLTYDPAQLYFGSDVFSYTISDGHGGSDTATVLLTVVKDITAPTVTGPAEAFFAQTVGSSTTRARVGWSGSDPGGTGIASYQLQLSINGGAFTTMALATPTSTSFDRTLNDGVSYRFRVRATDRQGNISAYVNGPTFTPLRIQNTSSSVVYTGSWATTTTSSALGGSYRYASSLSARASLTGTVRDFAWVATRTPTAGSAQVWIDGVFAATVNLRSTSTSYRQLVFQRHFPTLGSHTIEIRPIGGGPINLDAFLIYR